MPAMPYLSKRTIMRLSPTISLAVLLAVLQTTPGKRWAEEKGLNDRQYIVPGAGGVGEVLNNAWV